MNNSFFSFKKRSAAFILLMLPFLLASAEDVDTRHAGRDGAVPQAMLAGRPWLTPEFYTEMDAAIRGGRKTEAIGKLREARLRQRTERSAFRKSDELKQSVARQGSRTINTKRQASVIKKEDAAEEHENSELIIPDPGTYCMGQAFRLRVMGDVEGMMAYAETAMEVLTAIAEAPEETVAANQRAAALIRMGNIQEDLLRNYSMAEVYYKRALALVPDHPRLKRLALSVAEPSSAENTNGIQTEGAQ